MEEQKCEDRRMGVDNIINLFRLDSKVWLSSHQGLLITGVIQKNFHFRMKNFILKRLIRFRIIQQPIANFMGFVIFMERLKENRIGPRFKFVV